MSVRLLVRQRSEEGGADKATEVILDEEVITIGRDKSCQLVLAQQAVSRSHARISRDGTLFFLEDLGSAYGTEINGQKLPKAEKRLLRNGDVIAIAQFDLVFDRVADAPKGKDTGSTALVARQVVKDVMRGLSAGREPPYFRVMNGPKEGQRIELQDAQELVVGRDDGADVILKDDLVSRRHCKIRRDWSGTHVEDLGSRNGIKVNRKRIKKKTLKDRDELEIGGIRLLYLDPAEVREAPVVLPDEPEEEEVEATTHEPDPSEEPPPSEEPSGAEAEPQEARGAGEEEPGPAEEGPPPGVETRAEDALDEEPPPEDEDEPPPEEELPEEGDEPEEGRGKALSSGKAIIPLAAMGIFAILALVLIIAVLVGA